MNSRGAAKFAIGSESEMTHERPRDIVVSRPIEPGAPKPGSDDRIPVNPTRFDSRKDFKFRLNWIVCRRRLAHKRSQASLEGRGASRRRRPFSRKSPGLTQSDAITLERRAACDHEFEQADTVSKLGAGPEARRRLRTFARTSFWRSSPDEGESAQSTLKHGKLRVPVLTPPSLASFPDRGVAAVWSFVSTADIGARRYICRRCRTGADEPRRRPRSRHWRPRPSPLGARC